MSKKNRFAETVKPTKPEGATQGEAEFPEPGLMCLDKDSSTELNSIPARQMSVPVFSRGTQSKIKILDMAIKGLKEQK